MISRFTRLRAGPIGILNQSITKSLPLAYYSTGTSPTPTPAPAPAPAPSTNPSTTASPPTTPAPPTILSPENLLKRNYKYTTPRDITPLKEASALYATIHLYNRKYLVTEGDKVSIPVSFKEVNVGDVLNFDQVSVLGSRDYTLTGNPRINSNVFSIKGVVVENTRVKRSVFSKSKRRRRHVRHVVSKNALTVIRISELKVNQDY